MVSNQFNFLSDRITGSVNGEEAAIVLYIDFSKDFDIVSRDILISNMQSTWNYHTNDLKTSLEQKLSVIFYK